jgi:hypothetical protein
VRAAQTPAQQFNRIPDAHAPVQAGLCSAGVHMGDNAVCVGIGPVGNFSRAVINRSGDDAVLLQQFKPSDPGVVFAASGIVEKNRASGDINGISGRRCSAVIISDWFASVT